jgi:CheY-like chemotaxis protein
MNLVVNARDAMPQGGRLTIETKGVVLDEALARQHGAVLAGRYVVLIVSDSGHGIDPEARPHIFEPFFTTKDVGRGTGLGLSTVYGIVTQSGGHIEVYSESGRGTAFAIYLPEVKEEIEPTELVPKALGSPKGTATILLVEDDDLVRGVTHAILVMNGYTVLSASSGAEAVLVCKQHEGPIDLVMTDVVMPGMDGRQTAEHLTRLRPAVKVLYSSGYADDTIVRHGVLEPGTEFIQKPFTAEALARKIVEILHAGHRTSRHV